MKRKQAQPERALRDSELRYRRLFETARDGILILDVETGRISDVNPFLIELLGFSKSEIIGKTVGELSPVEDSSLNEDAFKRLRRDGYARYEHLPLKTKDGRRIVVEFVSNAYQESDHEAIQCNIRDITERKKYELAAAQSNAIVEFSDDAIIGKDLRGIITSWNSGAERLFGHAAHEMIGQSILRTVPPELRQEETEILARLRRGESVMQHDTKRLRKDGSVMDISATISPIKDSSGNIIGGAKVARDITRRKRVEEDLRASREQLRALTARIQEVREEDRTRAAREIHDVLAQELTGLKMDVEWMRRRMAMPIAGWDQDSLREKLDGLIGLISTVGASVQRIASGLRPAVLDTLGLPAALEWVAADFQKRTEILCKLSVRPEGLLLDNDQSTGLFRILQESLTNIARHAQATEVKICLTLSEGNVLLTISDNGVGIEQTHTGNSKSLGLLGMHERALLLDGTCAVERQACGGTKVAVRLPLVRLARPGSPYDKNLNC